MPNTHDFKTLYWAVQYHPRNAPYRFVEPCSMTENNEPWRLGAGYMIRLPLVRHGLIIGRWWGRGTPDSVPQGIVILGDRTEEVRHWKEAP